MAERINIKFQINNITEEQGFALYAMFKCMEYNGNIGHSEWVAYMSDGDGDFHPKISVEGLDVENNKMKIEKAKRSFVVDHKGKKRLPWTDSMSIFDFDGLGYIKESKDE